MVALRARSNNNYMLGPVTPTTLSRHGDDGAAADRNDARLRVACGPGVARGQTTQHSLRSLNPSTGYAHSCAFPDDHHGPSSDVQHKDTKSDRM